MPRRKATPEAEPEAREEEAGSQAPAEPSVDELTSQREIILASLPPEEARPKNIYGRLAQILGLIGSVRKRGWNAFHKYHYVQEADLVEAIRPILSAYGIWIEQSLAWDPENGIVGHERLRQVVKDRSGTITGETENLTKLVLSYEFVWWNDEAGTLERTEPVYFPGYGDDAGDKGAYKALTGAEKYFLMKTFLVATGDDPERDEDTDRRAATREAAGPVTVERGARQGGRQPTHGGRQQEASSAQTKQIKLLLAEAGIRSATDGLPLLLSLTGDTLETEITRETSAKLMLDYVSGLEPAKIGKLVRD